MEKEVWVGRVEVRQLPGTDHKITLSGKGAFTWVTCWASDTESYDRKVAEVMNYYGLFIVQIDQQMPFLKAEQEGRISAKLIEQCEETNADQDFCLYGTFHTYSRDQ